MGEIMARIVVEGIDDSVAHRFGSFCSAVGITKKELLRRYMTRVADDNTELVDDRLNVMVPVYVQANSLFVGEDSEEAFTPRGKA